MSLILAQMIIRVRLCAPTPEHQPVLPAFSLVLRPVGHSVFREAPRRGTTRIVRLYSSLVGGGLLLPPMAGWAAAAPRVRGLRALAPPCFFSTSQLSHNVGLSSHSTQTTHSCRHPSHPLTSPLGPFLRHAPNTPATLHLTPQLTTPLPANTHTVEVKSASHTHTHVPSGEQIAMNTHTITRTLASSHTYTTCTPPTSPCPSCSLTYPTHTTLG